MIHCQSNIVGSRKAMNGPALPRSGYRVCTACTMLPCNSDLEPHCEPHTCLCLPRPCSAAGFAAQPAGPDPLSPASAAGPTPQQNAYSTAPLATLQPRTPPASPPMSPPRRATGPPANSAPQTEARPLRHVRSLAAAQAAQQPDEGKASLMYRGRDDIPGGRIVGYIVG